jgi:hypothetical protein
MERNSDDGSHSNGARFDSGSSVVESPATECQFRGTIPTPPREITDGSPREKLLCAQKQRDACREKFERARSAVSLSREMIDALEEQLSRFSYIGSVVTEECVASIMKSIGGVERPQVEFSPETMTVWQQMIDIEKRLAAAKKAGEILERELQEAEHAFRDAEDRVKGAAIAMAALVVEPIAEELAGIETRAAVLRRILLGYAALRHAGQFLPLNKRAAMLLRGQKAAHDPQVVEHWGTFLNELDRNADASFVVKEFS